MKARGHIRRLVGPAERNRSGVRSEADFNSRIVYLLQIFLIDGNRDRDANDRKSDQE
jgi:hypothetical protein